MNHLTARGIVKHIRGKVKRESRSEMPPLASPSYIEPLVQASSLPMYARILTLVIKALKTGSNTTQGYDPANGILGYLVTGDPSFVTRTGNTRDILRAIGVDTLRWLFKNVDSKDSNYKLVRDEFLKEQSDVKESRAIREALYSTGRDRSNRPQKTMDPELRNLLLNGELKDIEEYIDNLIERYRIEILDIFKEAREKKSHDEYYGGKVEPFTRENAARIMRIHDNLRDLWWSLTLARNRREDPWRELHKTFSDAGDKVSDFTKKVYKIVKFIQRDLGSMGLRSYNPWDSYSKIYGHRFFSTDKTPYGTSHRNWPEIERGKVNPDDLG